MKIRISSPPSVPLVFPPRCVLIDNIFVLRNTGNLFLGEGYLGKIPVTTTEKLLQSCPHERRDIVGYGLCVLDIVFKATRETLHATALPSSHKGQSQSFTGNTGGQHLQVTQKCIERGEAPPEVSKVLHESLRHLIWFCFTTTNCAGLGNDGELYNHPFLRIEKDDNDAYCELGA